MKKSKNYQMFQALLTGLGASYILYIGISYKDENTTIFAATIPMVAYLITTMFKFLRSAISTPKA